MTSPTSAGLQHPVQPVATAGNDLNTVFHIVPRAATVSGVLYCPNAAITGANTNTRSLSLVNLGQNGTGTTVIATLQFNSGINAALGVSRTITLSGTPANLAVAAGDVLQWQSTHIGTGITDPGGLLSVVTAASYA